MGIATKFPAAPQEGDISLTDPRWRRWFLDVWKTINGIGNPLPSVVAPGVSPFVYVYTGAGNASLLVVGAGVVLVEFSRDSMTFYQAGLGSGSYQVTQGDRLRITYGGVLLLTLVLH